MGFTNWCMGQWHKYKKEVLPRATFLFFVIAIVFQSGAHVHARNVPQFKYPYKYVNQFIDNEQNHNDRVEDAGEFESHHDHTLPTHFLPENRPIFNLGLYYVPLDQLVVIDSTANGEWMSKLKQRWNNNIGIYFPFFVHPLSQGYFSTHMTDWMLPPQPEMIAATPQASHRSLVAWHTQIKGKDVVQPTPFFIKVSLDASVGGVRRLLTRAQLERASAASLALKLADMRYLNERGIYFIDEPLSVYLKNLEVGYSIRETPALKDTQQLVPMFSLYAKRPGGSMLAQLIKKSNLTPMEFARENIIRPLIENMFVMGFREGILPDPHEQNVTVLIDNDNWTGKFYYRDLGGVNINTRMRALAGKNMDFVPASFDFSSLGTERADIIDKIHTYLFQSNFYALAAAIREIDPDVMRADLINEARVILRGLIMQYTGYDARTVASQKAAIKRYLNQKVEVRKCYHYLLPQHLSPQMKKRKSA